MTTRSSAVGRHGRGDERRDAGAHLRAVLHDEAGRRRGGPRPRQRLRHGHAERRLRTARHGAGSRARRSPCISRWPSEPSASDAAGRRLPRRVAATPRALVVDDEQIVRELATTILRAARASRSQAAANGVGALELLSGMPEGIDVLVTDVSMPGMGGRELAARVAELLPGVPVVFMSGYSDEILGGAPDDRTPLTFLAKPFSPRTLVRAVREAVAWEPEPTTLPSRCVAEPVRTLDVRTRAGSPGASGRGGHLRDRRRSSGRPRFGLAVPAPAGHRRGRARGPRRRGAAGDRGAAARRLRFSTSRWSRSEASRSPGEIAQSQPETARDPLHGARRPRVPHPGARRRGARLRPQGVAAGRSAARDRRGRRRDAATSTPACPPRSPRPRASPRCRP